MKTSIEIRGALAMSAFCAVLSVGPLYAGINESLSLSAASDEYVLVPASTNLPPNTTSATRITLEAWINIPSAGVWTIVSRGDGGNGALTDFIFQISNDGGSAGTQVSFYGLDAWDVSSNGIPVNTWTHVAVTFDGTNKMFYINGALNKTAPRAGSLYLSGSALYIGRQGSVCDCNFFTGEMAEVRVWNTVRTASQIGADMQFSTGGEPGLVAYYHLNEGGGTMANDATGNGHTGTLMNGATWTSSAPPALGTSALLVGPAAGTNSVVLRSSAAWIATAFAPWLHLSTANQSGTGSTNVVFSYDANTGATRTGTLTIAGLTLTVTQAGSTYVAAQPYTTIVSTGANFYVGGMAVDGSGNVYITDQSPYALSEWTPSNNTLTTLMSSGFNSPSSVAVDGMGNVYTINYLFIAEWLAASKTLVSLPISQLAAPVGLAVDTAANVYYNDDYYNNTREWSQGSGAVATVASGMNFPDGVAVDAAGNVYITDTDNKVIREWVAASGTLVTLPIPGLDYPEGVAVDGSGNLYYSDADGNVGEWSPASHTVTTLPISIGNAAFVAVDGSDNVYVSGSPLGGASTVGELQQAFVVPTAMSEGAAPGTDSLPVVLPATENLIAPFAPSSSQSWLTITGVTNGVVSFAFTFNTGAARTAYITLLGQNIPVNQAAAANAGILGTSNRVEGPAAGSDSVVLASLNSTWNATANASWLHLSTANQSGASSTNVVFSFDANTGATRTGTLTIAGQTLTVTQAGSTYVAAPGPLTPLVSLGLNGPSGMAVDGSGNVYFADSTNNAIKEWSVANNTVTTLVSSGLNDPFGVALDGLGNVYFADSGNNAIKEWSASGHTVTTLVSSGLNAPSGVAVDGGGNVYIADSGNNAIKEWSATSHAVTALVTSGLNHPLGVAVDGAGNVYIADTTNNAIKEWLVASGAVATLVSSGLNHPYGVAVDGAGDVYFADSGNSAIKEWSAASNTVSTLVASGLNHPFAVAVDGSDNICIADTSDNAVKEQPRAFVDPTAKVESAAPGSDVLSVVLPDTENLLAPFAPSPTQPWLTISGVNNGVVSFAFTANTGAARMGNLTVLGQNIQVTQQTSALGVLAATNRLEGPAAGLDGVILMCSGTWVAAANASWLHLSAANQSGASSTNVIFSYDTNTGPTRTGTLTIAGQTLTVTQAGSNYIAAPTPATLVPSPTANGVAVDGAGNVYFSANNEIEEWLVASNTVATLVATGLDQPFGVAVDNLGNVYFADSYNQAIKEWSATSHTVTTLVSSGLNYPYGVAVDGAGNVYIADTGNKAIKEWLVASNTVTTLVSSGLYNPFGLALDVLGNVYIADTGNQAIKVWSATSHTVTTLVSSGLDYPYGVAVDGAGDVYIANNNSDSISEWSVASNALNTLVSAPFPFHGVAVDGAGNVYTAGGDGLGITELPHACLVPTPVSEGLGAGSDALPVVVPATENLLGPFAPTSSQSWLTITSVTNGVVSFAFTATATNRTGTISLLGQIIPVTQFNDLLSANLLYVGPGAGSNSVALTVNPAGTQAWTASSQASWLHLGATNGSGNAVVSFTYDFNTGPTRSGALAIAGQTLLVIQEALALGASVRLEGNAATVDSVVLASLNTPWTATTNASWLHLSLSNQSGTDSTNVIFSVDANTNATRTGTLTIAGLTLTVTQAGATYIPAPAPVTTLVSTNVLSYPYGVAVDGAGNVYVADVNNAAIYEWSPASNTVTTLPIAGLQQPTALAVDGSGNVYVADEGTEAVYEWSPTNSSVTTLPFAGLNFPTALAADGMGNVYLADQYNHSIYQWSPVNNTVATLVTNESFSPDGVAVDIAGNVYFSDVANNAVYEWSAASNTLSSLVARLNGPGGIRVDGAGNVYIADTYNNAIKEWSAATHTVTTLVSSGLNSPQDVAVDAMDNVYIADSESGFVKELPRAFLDPTAKMESAGAGSDSLPVVLPATEDLPAPFAPTSTQPWLTISGVTNGVVSFAFSVNNTGAPRTAGLTLLGDTISVTQSNAIAVPTLLTGATILPNGSFQFSFTNTPGATFTVLSSTNVALPLNEWTPAGAPVENPPGQYVFTGAAATNTQTYYMLRWP